MKGDRGTGLGDRDSGLGFRQARAQEDLPVCDFDPRSPIPEPGSLRVYCFSPQNGHFDVRACSGLRQCQQKLACGVSRALRRDWMSDT